MTLNSTLIMKRVSNKYRIVAFRAGGQQRNRRADQLFDITHIFDSPAPGVRSSCGHRPWSLPNLPAFRRSASPWLAALDPPEDNRLLRRPAHNPVQTLISSRPSSTSSLVRAIPLMPLLATAWRTSTASNQPHRRLRPVTVPNSWPRSPRNCPTSFCCSVGNGPSPTRVV